MTAKYNAAKYNAGSWIGYWNKKEYQWKNW